AREEYLKNFWLKGQRAISKAKSEGPAAWVLPADDPRPQLQAELVNLLQQQGAEVQRTSAAFTVKVEGPRKREAAEDQPPADGAKPSEPEKPQTKEFPAGSYIVRMDQPYSRIADMLLDQQYYSSEDRRPYDDSG